MEKVKANIHLILYLVLFVFSFIWLEYGLAWALLALAVVAYKQIDARRIWLHYSLLTVLMILYLVWQVVVLQFSSVPSISIIMFLILATLPVVYLVATNQVDFSKSWSIIRVALLVLGTVFGIWGILQVYMHVGRGFAEGPLVDRNAFAALLNLLWFPAVYLFLKADITKLGRILVSVCMFVISTALFATTSRAGIGLWLLLLPIVLWGSYQFTQSTYSVFKILSISLLAFLISNIPSEPTILNRSYDLTSDPSTGARLMLWKSSLHMFIEHPYFGTGWGTWSSYYPAFRLAEERTTAGYFAHNDYLQLADEGGVLTLILLLSILFVVIYHIVKNINFGRESNRFEALTLLLGVVAVLLHAGVNFIFNFAFLNIVIGFYLARVSQLIIVKKEFKLSINSVINGNLKKMILVLIIGVFSAPYLLNTLSLSCFYGKQFGMKIVNFIAPQFTAFEMATLITTIRPKENLAQDYLVSYAEYFLTGDNKFNVNKSLRKTLFNDAVERFDLMRKYSANKPSTGVREVELLLENHDMWESDLAFEKAHKILDENLQIDPYHAKSIIALSRLFIAEGKKAEAFNVLNTHKSKVMHRSEYQLIEVEQLKQMSIPNISLALVEIEKKLESDIVKTNAGEVQQANFNQSIDAELKKISSNISLLE